MPKIDPTKKKRRTKLPTISIGERLRDMRKARGQSQVEFAKHAGFPPAAISHFEHGRRAPTLKSLDKLRQAFGADWNQLLMGVQF